MGRKAKATIVLPRVDPRDLKKRTHVAPKPGKFPDLARMEAKIAPDHDVAVYASLLRSRCLGTMYLRVSPTCTALRSFVRDAKGNFAGVSKVGSISLFAYNIMRRLSSFCLL